MLTDAAKVILLLDPLPVETHDRLRAEGIMRARAILESRRALIDRVASALSEKGRLNSEDVAALAVDHATRPPEPNAPRGLPHK